MQYDTMPTTPGALLGHRKNGQPIYLIAGGSGEGQEDGGQTGNAGESGQGAPQGAPNTDPPPNSGQPSNPPASQPPAPQDPAPPTGPSNDDGLDERSRRAIDAVRQDFKDERSKRQAAEKQVKDFQTQLDTMKSAQQEQLDAIAKALGLKPDDTPPDPAELTKQLETAQADARKRADAHREAEVKLAVYQAAPDLGAAANRLLDSASFLRKVAGLDPSAEDFATRVSEAITAAVEADPWFKTAPATPPPPPTPTPTIPKSGGEFSGAPGGNRPWTDEDIARATPAQLEKAINDGLLEHMGYGPARR
ncbi:hypothetical protein [Actinoallomurus sp. NPDC052274]|uniref:hypothetical protein n=1 Tax=Actinoallomurus sp. NPDC052274 TaxID=3155420 RepID=UPI00341A4FF2